VSLVCINQNYICREVRDTRMAEDCADRDVEGIGVKMHVHAPHNSAFLCYSVR